MSLNIREALAGAALAIGASRAARRTWGADAAQPCGTDSRPSEPDSPISADTAVAPLGALGVRGAGVGFGAPDAGPPPGASGSPTILSSALVMKPAAPDNPINPVPLPSGPEPSSAGS
jgi:hypothetical protein